MLNAGWFEPGLGQYLAPNLVAEAARDFGINDDRVRLALANAALREGQKVGRLQVAAEVASEASGVAAGELLTRAKSPEVAARIKSSTAEFHALQVTQRPAFVLENSIGDRAVFSGLVKVEPLAVALEALLADEAAYGSFRAHFGNPPVQ
jgi:predicted DsbA family dithiol-disulfide isomerase